MNFTKAIAAYKQMKNDANVTAFGKNVDRIIDNSIRNIKHQIQELEADLEEDLDEQEKSMLTQILNIDEAQLGTKDSRKQYAVSYVKTVAAASKEYNDNVEKIRHNLVLKKEELKRFEELKKTLANIDVEKLIEKSK